METVIDRRRHSAAIVGPAACVILFAVRDAHAMTGLAGLAGLALLYCAVLATIAQLLAAAMAGWRFVPWAVGSSFASVILLFATFDLDHDRRVFRLALLVPAAATCTFLVLGYRREGSFLRRLVRTTLLLPSGFRDVAGSRSLLQGAAALVIASILGFQHALGLDRALAQLVLSGAGWLLLVAIVWIVARLVPPGRVDDLRVARCVLFATVPAAAFVPILRIVYDVAHVDLTGYRHFTTLLVYPAYAWIAIVLYVALRAALERGRLKTLAIAALATLAFALTARPRAELWRMLAQVRTEGATNAEMAAQKPEQIVVKLQRG